MNHPLRIGYVTTGSANDVGNWSGLVVNIRNALQDQGHELHAVDQVTFQAPLSTRLQGWWCRFVARQVYGYDRDLALARKFAAKVDRRLRALELDCIVSPRTYPTAMLQTRLPIASWSDATFHRLLETYPGYAKISPSSIRQGHELERSAMKRSLFLAFASHWAAEDAVRFYGVDPAKIAVIPFGPNCAPPFPTFDQAQAAITAKSAMPFKMLFVGFDWERKGGPLAVGVLQELQRRGVEAELWIVGCQPFEKVPPKGVRVMGIVDKSDHAGMDLWRKCFRDCHVFLMPTRAECFGVVYAEAAAYGLPSLGTRICGVPDAVAEGKSGWLFDLKDGPIPYAELLVSLAHNKKLMEDASITAWEHHHTELNWQRSAECFIRLFTEKLSPSSAAYC